MFNVFFVTCVVCLGTGSQFWEGKVICFESVSLYDFNYKTATEVNKYNMVITVFCNRCSSQQ